MLYPCQIECFILIIVDIYISNLEATRLQISNILSYLEIYVMTVTNVGPNAADRSGVVDQVFHSLILVKMSLN